MDDFKPVHTTLSFLCDAYGDVDIYTLTVVLACAKILCNGILPLQCGFTLRPSSQYSLEVPRWFGELRHRRRHRTLISPSGELLHVCSSIASTSDRVPAREHSLVSQEGWVLHTFCGEHANLGDSLTGSHGQCDKGLKHDMST